MKEANKLFPTLKRERVALDATVKYLLKKGFDRVEPSKTRDHDLDAYKNGMLYPVEVKARKSKMVNSYIYVSFNEFNLFKSNPNALLIRVRLDENEEVREIQEFTFKDVESKHIASYAVRFKKQ